MEKCSRRRRILAIAIFSVVILYIGAYCASVNWMCQKNNGYAIGTSRDMYLYTNRRFAAPNRGRSSWLYKLANVIFYPARQVELRWLPQRLPYSHMYYSWIVEASIATGNEELLNHEVLIKYTWGKYMPGFRARQGPDKAYRFYTSFPEWHEEL